MSSISTKLLWSRTICILGLVLIRAAFVGAQIQQTDRYELPVHGKGETFDILAASDNGLFLHRQYIGTREDQIHLIKLDTGFNEQWAGIIGIQKNYRLMATSAFNQHLFLLLRYKDYSKNDLILYVLQERDGSYAKHNVKSYIPFSPTIFEVTETSALIGGYYNRIPVVLYYSFATGSSRVLPGLFNEAGELTQIKIQEDGSFDVLISAKNLARQRTIWIKSYDPEGNLLRNLPLTPEENKHLIFGRSLKMDGNRQIVAGVYGNRSSEFSRGLFIATIDPSGLEQIRYYNFGDLKNFFQYMKANREKRIKNRIERKKIKGKKIKFNYRFLVHELVPYRDQFVLLGEAFYPKYRSTEGGQYRFFSPIGFMPGSGSVIQNGRIFDGYHYTHAVVMGFNENGRLLWDNSFEINDVKTFTLEQFVKLEVLPDKLALMYLYENHIRTKLIQNDLVLEGKSVDPIKTMYDRDIVKGEKNVNKLEYWYDGYLFAYGIQEIVSPSSQGSQKRRVFFINKINYDEKIN